MSKTITAEEFTRVVGSAPQQDDLERANCPIAGEMGHWGCGWCEHDKPRWMCVPCAHALFGTKREAIRAADRKGEHHD
jgi:hypothetical protein